MDHLRSGAKELIKMGRMAKTLRRQTAALDISYASADLVSLPASSHCSLSDSITSSVHTDDVACSFSDLTEAALEQADELMRTVSGSVSNDDLDDDVMMQLAPVASSQRSPTDAVINPACERTPDQPIVVHIHARQAGMPCRCHSSSLSAFSMTDLDGTSDVSNQSDMPAMISPHKVYPPGYYTVDSRPVTSKHSRRSLTDKKLLSGVKQFNLDPKKGLDYLHKNEFLDAGSAEDVASFLFREGRLSKKQIGAFLGDHHEFNRQVLKCFVAKHEFMHLILVQALRQFLWSFRLPGEAMQIDRIMEAFAWHYCQQNPDLFDEPDTCYILSFSIIMLNTALHNPNVRQKITLEQFVSQNKGINSGKDLPRDILELIYKNIKDEPFKIPNETYDDLMYTFFSPEKEGWLLKQGGNWKSWKRRWFVLSDRCLYYFQHTAENVPKGIIPLENVKVRVLEDKDSRLHCFEVYSETHAVVKGCKTDASGTVVQGHHKSYRMRAHSKEEMMQWVDSIAGSIKEHAFYDVIHAKKAALRRKSLKHGSHHDIPVTTCQDKPEQLTALSLSAASSND